MKVHQLKSLPEFFTAIHEGRKTFEIRKDDRGFSVGDILHLHEFDVATVPRFTGRCLMLDVIYVSSFGMLDGYVVMSVRRHFE